MPTSCKAKASAAGVLGLAPLALTALAAAPASAHGSMGDPVRRRPAEDGRRGQPAGGGRVFGGPRGDGRVRRHLVSRDRRRGGAGGGLGRAVPVGATAGGGHRR
ncbi:hypothetical protein GCM10017687_42870 [Streptomyces echinatus]|uniref:Uncharacterized protein n=1 Tax=Streptomyces echinatus TaxID=67293 RepID=A0A7W9PYQ8_9ACTN|nr:hypothetical protein [Streptomyces echinatus]